MRSSEPESRSGRFRADSTVVHRELVFVKVAARSERPRVAVGIALHSTCASLYTDESAFGRRWLVLRTDHVLDACLA